MNRKKITAAAGVTLLCIGCAWFALHSVAAITAVSPLVEEDRRTLPVIVIDPGHGGFDGGAVGVGGLVEKDVNLAVAQKLYDLFTINGFEAVLTRSEDVSLEDGGLSTTRQKKNSDIHNRMALADSYENAILLSIHQNKFPQEKYFGAQVFYGPQNEDSARFAGILQRRFIEMVQPENTRLEKPCTDDVYLIYHAKMPALLVECGFLSNSREAMNLVDDAYQQKLAFAIFTATAEYLGLEAPEDMENLSGMDDQNGGNQK